MATDVRASGAFYTAVLGWTVPEPDEQWGGYVVAEVDGQMVAGIGPVQEGAPRRLDALPRDRRRRAPRARRLAEHGGTVLAPGHRRRPARPHGDPRRPGRGRLRAVAGRDDDRREPGERAGRAHLGGPALERPGRLARLLRRAVRPRVRPRRDGRARLHDVPAARRAGAARRHGPDDGLARGHAQPLARLLQRSRTPTPPWPRPRRRADGSCRRPRTRRSAGWPGWPTPTARPSSSWPHDPDRPQPDRAG